jgi:hypothetical protein
MANRIMFIRSHDESTRVWKQNFFLHYFVVADVKSTASLFNTENSDPPPRRCLFIVHKSENYIEEPERGRRVKSPCASSAYQLPLLIHHSHTITHTLTPPWYIMSCLHPYSQEARPDSVRARCSMRAAILVPKWQSTHAHTALNTTPTLAHSYQALNLKVERACSGIRLNPLKTT